MGMGLAVSRSLFLSQVFETSTSSLSALKPQMVWHIDEQREPVERVDHKPEVWHRHIRVSEANIDRTEMPLSVDGRNTLHA